MTINCGWHGWGFNSITEIRSLNTEPPTIEKENSVTTVDASIIIGGYDGNTVIEVYGIGGNLIYSGHDATITGLDPRAYVVRIGSYTTKVML